MKQVKFLLGLLAILIGLIASFLVLSGDNAAVVHPKGVIARRELQLILTNILLMLGVILPTLILVLLTAWNYRASNPKAKYDPDSSQGAIGQLLLWVIPSVVIAVMAPITWKATHELDPYRPLKSDVKPLTIQVVALNWKWLFLYPEQGIATVNFVQFPVHTPVHFSLSADGSPMNSFWIPQLSGQIYSMTGMVTSLHLMSDEPGDYSGKAVEINGAGYADMTFTARVTSSSDFEKWVQEVKRSPLQLTEASYKQLVVESQKHPVTLYSSVEKDLFDKIVLKPLSP